MAEQTKIEWADHTFNPWVGCTKISPACDNCYAEEWANRFKQVKWGNHPRKRTSTATWKQPIKWQRQAFDFYERTGRKQFVFCASLADVFDNQVPDEWRADLWQLIKECHSMVWLLLTKRPQNIESMLPDDWGSGYPNVWLGTTVENQEVADSNVPILLNAPTTKRFLSIEPILGPIDLTRIDDDWTCTDALRAQHWIPGQPHKPKRVGGIDWVITGGESGKNARPAHPDWYRSLRDQCVEAGVPFHFKQWGEFRPAENYMEAGNYPILVNSSTEPDDVRRTMSECFHLDHQVEFHCQSEAVKRAMVRVGKSKGGRELDGRAWDERPEA